MVELLQSLRVLFHRALDRISALVFIEITGRSVRASLLAAPAQVDWEPLKTLRYTGAG